MGEDIIIIFKFFQIKIFLTKMCKHILNAQVSIRAPCCRKWFDCPLCHDETQDHELERSLEMVFRKEVNEDFEEADEYCPNCDNHYIIEAKTKADQGKLVIEFKAEKGHENKVFKDDREKERGRVLQADTAWGNDSESDEDFCLPAEFSHQIGGSLGRKAAGNMMA